VSESESPKTTMEVYPWAWAKTAVKVKRSAERRQRRRRGWCEIFQEKITARTKEYDNRSGQELHQAQHQSSIARRQP
jgi:hypothetical protein